MVQSMEFINFKAFKDSGKVNLKKINILVGPNSGGKSSFIKGILALKNTIDSRYSEGPIDLNKEIGDYKSIVYNHDYNNNIRFRIEFNRDSLNKNRNIDYCLFKIAEEIRKRNNGDIRYILDNLVEVSEECPVKLMDFSLTKNDKGRIVVDKFIVDYFNKKRLEITLKDQDYSILFNNNIIEISNLLILNKFYFKINEDALEKAKMGELKIIALIYNTFELIKKDFKRFTNGIIHISSYRNKPDRIEYVSRISSSDTVGRDGENVITALINSLNEKKERINFWLKEFNLAEGIEIKDFGNNTYSIFIKDKDTGIVNNILDVGVGTSQLLPIIIESINSKKGSTLIIEEPEVHIHPGAQSKLGDLFVQCAIEDNKQFIIETHSIFLITQLEILVAQGKISAEDIGVYYVEHGEEGAKVKDMRLSSNGQFEEPWPSGFFDVNYNLGKILFEFM